MFLESQNSFDWSRKMFVKFKKKTEKFRAVFFENGQADSMKHEFRLIPEFRAVEM